MLSSCVLHGRIEGRTVASVYVLRRTMPEPIKISRSLVARVANQGNIEGKLHAPILIPILQGGPAIYFRT
jgi:hypothetical protein